MILPDWRVHEGSGPHLLLVHGFLSSRSQWLLNLEALAAGCTPVTVELYGHSNSPSPEDPDCYRPDYYVRAFEAIRQELGVERWFLLGYSMGAGLTLRYAFNHPDRTIGHLFTNSTSGLADRAKQAELKESSAKSAASIRRWRSGRHGADSGTSPAWLAAAEAGARSTGSRCRPARSGRGGQHHRHHDSGHLRNATDWLKTPVPPAWSGAKRKNASLRWPSSPVSNMPLLSTAGTGRWSWHEHGRCADGFNEAVLQFVSRNTAAASEAETADG